MKCAVKPGSDDVIFVPSFMKTGTDDAGILRICLNSLKGCNVGITALMIEGIFGVCR
jgi:hypothetical protein